MSSYAPLPFVEMNKHKNENRSSPTCSFPACCELLEFQLCRENIKYVSTLHVNFHKSTHYISYHGLLHVCTNKYFTAKYFIAHPHVISNTFFFQGTQKIVHAALAQIKSWSNSKNKIYKSNIKVVFRCLLMPNDSFM